MEPEVAFLALRFLEEAAPDSFDAVRREIEARHLLPDAPRNLHGEPSGSGAGAYARTRARLSHITAASLPQMLEVLMRRTFHSIPPSDRISTPAWTLLGAGANSLTRAACDDGPPTADAAGGGASVRGASIGAAAPLLGGRTLRASARREIVYEPPARWQWRQQSRLPLHVRLLSAHSQRGDADALAPRANVAAQLVARELSGRRLRPACAVHARRLEVSATVQGHVLEAYCIVFDRSGGVVFTGSDDRLIKAWSTQSATLLRTMRGHEGDITDLAVRADNALLASASNDNTVRLWRLADGAPLRLLVHRSSPINSLQFGPDVCAPHWLAVGCSGSQALVFDTRTLDASPTRFDLPAPAAPPPPPPGAASGSAHAGTHAGAAAAAASPPVALRDVVCVLFDKAGESLLLSATDGAVHAWPLPRARAAVGGAPPGGTIIAHAPSSDGAPAGAQRLRSPQHAAGVALRGHTGWVAHIAFSRCGSRVLTCSRDGTARIFAWRPHWAAAVAGGPKAAGGAAGGGAAGGGAAGGAAAGTLACELVLAVQSRAAAGCPGRARAAPAVWVDMAQWSAADRLVVTSESERARTRGNECISASIRIWCARTGTLLHTLDTAASQTYMLEPHPWDDRLIASGGYGGRASLIETVSGRVLCSFGDAHGWSPLLDGHFAHDGALLALTDLEGKLTLLGTAAASRAMARAPSEQFFGADYTPLVRDAHYNLLDADSQQPPHLVAPGALLDLHARPHPPHLQPQRAPPALAAGVALRAGAEGGVDAAGDASAPEGGAAAAGGGRVGGGGYVALAPPLRGFLTQPDGGGGGVAAPAGLGVAAEARARAAPGGAPAAPRQAGAAAVARGGGGAANRRPRGRLAPVSSDDDDGEAAHAARVQPAQRARARRVASDDDDDDESSGESYRPNAYGHHAPHAPAARAERARERAAVSSDDESESSGSDSDDGSSCSDEAAGRRVGRRVTRRAGSGRPLGGRRVRGADDDDDDADGAGGGRRRAASRGGAQRARAAQGARRTRGQRVRRGRAWRSSEESDGTSGGAGGCSDGTSDSEAEAALTARRADDDAGAQLADPRALACADSDWLMRPSQRAGVYIPQVGDFVVYCREGHALRAAHAHAGRELARAGALAAPAPLYQTYPHLPLALPCVVTRVRYAATDGQDGGAAGLGAPQPLAHAVVCHLELKVDAAAADADDGAVRLPAARELLRGARAMHGHRFSLALARTDLPDFLVLAEQFAKALVHTERIAAALRDGEPPARVRVCYTSTEAAAADGSAAAAGGGQFDEWFEGITRAVRPGGAVWEAVQVGWLDVPARVRVPVEPLAGATAGDAASVAPAIAGWSDGGEPAPSEEQVLHALSAEASESWLSAWELAFAPDADADAAAAAAELVAPLCAPAIAEAQSEPAELAAAAARVADALALPALRELARAPPAAAEPGWWRAVCVPLDLALIGRRLSSGYYRRLSSALADVDTLVANSQLLQNRRVHPDALHAILSAAVRGRDASGRAWDELAAQLRAHEGTGARAEASAGMVVERVAATSGAPTTDTGAAGAGPRGASGAEAAARAAQAELLQTTLQRLLDELSALDVNGYFQKPPRGLPGYDAVVSSPMDFQTIRTKLARRRYGTIAELSADVQLICANALRYNQTHSRAWASADGLLSASLPLISSAAEAFARERIGLRLELGLDPTGGGEAAGTAAHARAGVATGKRPAPSQARSTERTGAAAHNDGVGPLTIRLNLKPRQPKREPPAATPPGAAADGRQSAAPDAAWAARARQSLEGQVVEVRADDGGWRRGTVARSNARTGVHTVHFEAHVGGRGAEGPPEAGERIDLTEWQWRPGPRFCVGQAVRAQWGHNADELWFDAVISAVRDDGTYDVHYKDGDTESAKAEERICEWQAADSDEPLVHAAISPSGASKRRRVRN